MTETGTTLYLEAFWLSLLAGSAIFIGALLASREHIRPAWLEEELHHGIIALGGGALLAAIALVLVPEGLREQPLWTAIVTFIAGGIAAMMVDRYLTRHNSTASQLVAMVLDFIPETIVIGAIITKDYSQALLLAIIIFAQNLPESFNAFREIKSSNTIGTKHLLAWFLLIGLSGPAYVYIGATALAQHYMWLAMLMTFCAGGILYLVFNDIAPEAKLKNHWLPPMGALLGFLIGMIGFELAH